MNMFKFLLGLLGAVSTGVMAALRPHESCYHRGAIFSNMHDEHGVPAIIDDVIIDFCVNLAMPVGDWKVGQTVAHCFPFPKNNPRNGNRVNMEVKNEAPTKQSLTADECIFAMRWLYQNCWDGGSDVHNGFHFTIDPNLGRC